MSDIFLSLGKKKTLKMKFDIFRALALKSHLLKRMKTTCKV